MGTPYRACVNERGFFDLRGLERDEGLIFDSSGRRASCGWSNTFAAGSRSRAGPERSSAVTTWSHCCGLSTAWRGL
jgi:hypothetical protein